MPFLSNYNSAMKVLSEIGTGTCAGRCKTLWIRNIRYALKSKTNPLGLTAIQRKRITEKYGLCLDATQLTLIAKP